MNAHILICGLVGGLFAVFTLSWPLFPLDRMTMAGSVPPETAFAGYMLTVLIGVGAGYTAARWSWAESTVERIKCGVLAGLLVGLIACSLMGAPAAAVASQAPIFQHGPHPALSRRDAFYIWCECNILASWYPFLAFWALVGGGAILGGLGGFLSSRFGKTPWGAAPPKTEDVFDASFAIMVVCFAVFIAGIKLLLPFEQISKRGAVKFGLELSMPIGGITGCLFATIFPLLVISAWFCGRLCAGRWSHPSPGMRRMARQVTYSTLFLQLLTMVLPAFDNRDIYKNWVFLLGMAAWVSVSLYWVTQTWLEKRRLSASGIAVSPSPDIKVLPPLRERLEGTVAFIMVYFGVFAMTRPSWLYFLCGVVMVGVGVFWGYPIWKRNLAKNAAKWSDHSSFQNRLLINAGFLGLTFPCLFVSSLLSPLAAYGHGIGRFQEVLFSPSPPLVASNTVALAASPTGTSSYAALAVLVCDNAYAQPPMLLHPKASEQTLQIFAYHVRLSMALAVIWIAFAIIHAGGLLWLHKLGRRQNESIAEGGTDPTQVPAGNT